MGSTTSSPVPAASLSEKTHTATRTRSAVDLLSSLSLRAPATAALSYESIDDWRQKFESSPKNILAATVLHKGDFLAALVDRKVGIKDQQGEWAGRAGMSGGTDKDRKQFSTSNCRAKAPL